MEIRNMPEKYKTKSKENHGQISVFACVMVAVFLILILAVLQGIRIWEAKARCYQAVASSIDSLKGDYQPDLFRRYHLLAIDETYYGRGQGYMEERLEEYLDYNLNSDSSLYIFDVEEAVITPTDYLVEDSLSGMKKQIRTYMQQKLPVDLASTLFGKLEQEDSSELDSLWSQAADEDGSGEAAINLTEVPSAKQLDDIGISEDLDAVGGAADGTLTVEELVQFNQEYDFLQDPREALDYIQKAGILYLVMPSKAGSISSTSVDLGQVPSAQYSKNNSVWELPVFSGVSSVKELIGLLDADSDIEQFDSSSYGMDELYGIAYVLDSFQGVQNTFYEEDGEAHVFDYEVEYILEGKDSDCANVTAVANQLLLLRLVPNAAYAFSSKEMKSETTLVATILLVPIDMEVLIKPVSYVFLACWAYGESLMDVKTLFQGGYVPIVKNEENWQLSLNGIASLAMQETEGCEEGKGLNYSEYIAFLLAVMPDSEVKYYRMLDIMELNIQEDLPDFEIEHCVDEFMVQVQVQEQGYHWYIDGTGSYLE